MTTTTGGRIILGTHAAARNAEGNERHENTEICLLCFLVAMACWIGSSSLFCPEAAGRRRCKQGSTGTHFQQSCLEDGMIKTKPWPTILSKLSTSYREKTWEWLAI